MTPHDSYDALGETPEQRAAAYRRLFQFELDEEVLKEIRSAANGGFALGNQRFKDEISAMLGTGVERLRQRLRQRASQSGWSVPFAAEIAWQRSHGKIANSENLDRD